MNNYQQFSALLGEELSKDYQNFRLELVADSILG